MTEKGETEAEPSAEALRWAYDEWGERQRELMAARSELGKHRALAGQFAQQMDKAQRQLQQAGSLAEQQELRATAERLAADRAEAEGLVEVAEQAVRQAEQAVSQAELKRERANLRATAEHLGRAVQVRRAELGLKRPELAKRADLSYPYTSEIENGSKTPSSKALGQLAEALELSAAQLLTRAERLEMDASSLRRDELDQLRAEESAQKRLDFVGGAEARALGPGVPAPLRRDLVDADRADRPLEEAVAAIVRAELASWARTELPNLIRAELERIRSNREREQ
jgi:YD repeat-containing protein